MLVRLLSDNVEVAADEGLLGQGIAAAAHFHDCLLYTSDAADERSSVDLGGRRIIKKKKNEAKETSMTDTV